MSFDAEYSRLFFDVWYDGLRDMKMLEQRGIVANNGFSHFSGKIEGEKI